MSACVVTTLGSDRCSIRLVSLCRVFSVSRCVCAPVLLKGSGDEGELITLVDAGEKRAPRALPRLILRELHDDEENGDAKGDFSGKSSLSVIIYLGCCISRLGLTLSILERKLPDFTIDGCYFYSDA